MMEKKSKRNDIGFFPSADDRALIVGQTGSGKTHFAKWLITKLNRPVIIYDTKHERGFDDFAIISDNIRAALNVAKRHGISIYRPSSDKIANLDSLNSDLEYHFLNGSGITAYIDELYSFHKTLNPVLGLRRLLTQGRSKDIGLIMSTQRPSQISTFSLSESDFFYIFTLTNEKDIAKLDGYIPGLNDVSMPKKGSYQFYFYNVAKSEKPLFFKPIRFVEKYSKKLPKL